MEKSSNLHVEYMNYGKFYCACEDPHSIPKKHCNDRCHIITGQPPNNGHLSTVATFLCPQVAMLEKFNCICLSHIIKTEYSYYFAPWLNNNLSLPDECNYMNSITVQLSWEVQWPPCWCASLWIKQSGFQP